MGRVPNSRGHLERLINIGKEENKTKKLRPVEQEWAPCGRKRPGMLGLEKKWGTCGEIKQVTEGQILSLHECQPGVRGFIDSRWSGRKNMFSFQRVADETVCTRRSTKGSQW